MPMTTTPTLEQTDIRRHLDAVAQAIRAKDVDAVMAHYAADAVAFDVMPPLQVPGAGAYRKNFVAWFSSIEGPIDYEMRDMHIAAGNDVAFCHYLGHVRGTRSNGRRADYWVRVSSGLRKVNGAWLITHEHVSMPSSHSAVQRNFHRARMATAAGTPKISASIGNSSATL